MPDGLGGWHVVQLLQAGQDEGAGAVLREAELRRQGRLVAHAEGGQRFTVHLKGLGWTQLDNTIAVDYDNSYVGYGCGFNSQGDIVMNLVATGGPGTHLIDMYPLLYTQQPSYANTPYGMIPVLTYARGCTGPRARLQAAGDALGDHGRQVGGPGREGEALASPSAFSAATSSSGRRLAISDGTRTARTSVASMSDGEREAEAELLQAGDAAGDEAGRTRRP